jgi:hypothetical protein
MLLALIKICLLCDVRQNEAYHASFEKNQNLNYRWESLSSYCQNFELYGGQIDFYYIRLHQISHCDPVTYSNHIIYRTLAAET